MTLSEWLIKEYGNKKAWKTGTDTQTKRVNIQKLLDVFGREELLRQAKQLEEEGILELKLQNMGSEIKAIKFPIERLELLYRRENRKSAREIISEQQVFIRELWENTNVEWLRNYYEEQLEQLQRGNEARNANDREFLVCLQKISELKNHVWERMFSEEVFHDSKKFQRKYRTRVVSVLRKVLGESGNERKDYEILAEFGVMSYSQSLCWKGRMVYEIGGEYRVDTENQRYGTVINAQTLVNSIPVVLPGVRKIVTIENKANYEDRRYDSEILYLFVHGFLSPKERNFLRHICSLVSEDTEFLHWGDMDLGGMRIFHFLKKELFPNIKPYKMDEASYLEALGAGKGIPFDEQKRKRYEAFDAKELEPLKQCILKYGKDMEQEGISYDNEG